MKLILETSYDFKIEESKLKENKDLFLVGIFSTADVENANKRKYKKEILEREVNSLIESKINNKCCWGQLGHPSCVSGDTEVLTENGWKIIKDVNIGDKVATLNTETDEIEYNNVYDKVEEHYEGKMYRFKNRQMNMLFTPNHRFLLTNRYNKKMFATSQEIDECDTRKYIKSHIPKTGDWWGLDDSIITLKGYDHVPHSKYDYIDDVEIDLYTFMSFMGIFLSEGHVTKDNNNGIYIYQNVGDSADMIEDMLNNFPNEMKWNKNVRNGKCIFSLSDARLANILKPLGDCYTKYIPYEYKQYNPKYLYQLLYWFGVGDGRGFLSDDKYTKRNVFSVSEKLIDDLHEIALKCGISCRKTMEICKSDYKFCDRIIKAENKKPLYFLEILSTKGIYLSDKFMTINKESYKGNVYCLRVPNENFYVRNKDSVSFWTGNSPDTNLDRVAIQTVGLEWKGNNVFGRAKVLKNTPMGSIAEELLKEGRLGISSRGLGSVNEDGYVNEDFRLLTYDIVSDPSNPGSEYINGIYEAKEFFIATEDDTTKKIEEMEIDKNKAREIYLEHTLSFLDSIIDRSSFYKINEKEEFEKIYNYLNKSEFWLKTALECSEDTKNKDFYKILYEHYEKLRKFTENFKKNNK